MATQVKFRRGTTAQTAFFVGAVGEITVDTTANTISVHDGVTAGGNYLTKQNDFTANVSYISGVDLTQNNLTLIANTTANFAYAQANIATNNAASASLYANTGIANANSASLYANTGIANANSASLYANNAINYLGANVAIIAGVDSTQNNLIFIANSIASTANTTANFAYVQANTANNNAASASLYANTALNYLSANVSIISGIDFTQNTNINVANTTANFAYAQANTANSLAQASFDYANSIPMLPIISVTTSNTSQQTVDSFSTSTYRTAKYIAQITSLSEYHVIEILIVHDGTTPYLTQYGEIYTVEPLGTFDSSISSGKLNLLFTPKYSITKVNLIRNNINV
jgi:hypothetical protein